MGCEPFLREEDTEIVERWIRKVETTINQDFMPNGFRVDYVTQLLFDSAQTWQDRVQERRTAEILLWVDFKVELRIYTTPDNTRGVKNKSFQH